MDRLIVRAAELDKLLPPEADAPVPSVAGAHVNFGLVEELHGIGLSTGGFPIH